MSEDLSKAAAELLELEQKSRQGRLTRDEGKRWFALAMKLFRTEGFATRRRSFRIPCDHEGKLGVQGRALSCRVVQLSHIGLAVELSGPLEARKHDEVIVKTMRIAGSQVELDLRCEIVTKDEGGHKAGLHISDHNSQAVRTRYFDRAYYPTYLSHLQGLAGR